MATPKAPRARGGDGRPLKRNDNNPPANAESVAADELRSLVERIERLNEEKANIAADIKDVYAEAKSRGFDVKQLRKVVALRKQDHSARQEEEAILELYLQALGMT